MILRNGIDTNDNRCDLPWCGNRYYDYCIVCDKKVCLKCLSNILDRVHLKCPFCRTIHRYHGKELNLINESYGI